MTAGTTGSTSSAAHGSMSGQSSINLAALNDSDVKKLQGEQGREFDQRYVKMMVKEHEDAVKLFENASREAKDPEIRSFASQHVSALREHLQEAKGLERSVAAE
ncbi:MAG TPA: DUF4142 domain-containing protein [Candidatus Synoicihabitans sp.]|nr:DUF4142 domain-containing protein [Candidatus Synoicihabitans sp.]